MKKIFNIYFLLISVSIFAVGCTDELPQADATFEIWKDTTVNFVVSRIPAVVFDTITPVIFVYKGTSQYNCVWPGDRVQLKYSINKLNPTTGAYVAKPIPITYFLNHDYDTRLDSVLLNRNKKDTLFIMAAAKYAGIPLPTGNKEISYKFRTQGELTVTWVANNVNSETKNQKISQQRITVK